MAKTKPKDDEAPRLLSGGNPQIAKGDGDAVVQKYIAAMPGWKHDIGVRLDRLFVEAVPELEKAVRWNSPFYGMPGQGWYLSFHCFTHFVRVTFLFGQSLDPLPPGPSKDPNTRYLDIREDHDWDEDQIRDWVRQGSKLPGWTP